MSHHSYPKPQTDRSTQTETPRINRSSEVETPPPPPYTAPPRENPAGPGLVEAREGANDAKRHAPNSKGVASTPTLPELHNQSHLSLRVADAPPRWPEPHNNIDTNPSDSISGLRDLTIGNARLLCPWPAAPHGEAFEIVVKPYYTIVGGRNVVEAMKASLVYKTSDSKPCPTLVVGNREKTLLDALFSLWLATADMLENSAGVVEPFRTENSRPLPSGGAYVGNWFGVVQR